MRKDHSVEEPGPTPGDPRHSHASGLARSLRALFDVQEVEGPSPEVDVPLPDGSTEPLASGEDTDQAESADEAAAARGDTTPLEQGVRSRFTTRVARYLRGSAEERDRVVPGLLELARSLRGAGELRAVADAVVALAVRGNEEDDEVALALAGELMDSAVITHLVGQLGSEQDPDRRAALTRISIAFPDRLAPAVVDTLAEAPDRAMRQNLEETQHPG